MTDHFNTVLQNSRVQIKVKDSKFIASVAPVGSEAEAEDFITRVSKEFFDATHNVSAYKIGVCDQAIRRYDDDGEPASSSGPPVLQAIEGVGVTNTVVVVTRYFGGTKLGFGGLVRAYGDAAAAGLLQAGVREMVQYILVKISISYEKMGNVIKEVQSGVGVFKDTQYSNTGVEIFVDLLPSYFENFHRKIIDATRGSAEIIVEQKEYRG